MKKTGFFRPGVVAAVMLALGHGAVSAQDTGGPAASRLKASPLTITVTVKADGVFLMDGMMVSRDGLQAQLAVIAAMQPQPEVHISSDPGAGYGDVAFAMAATQRAGIRRLGVIGGT